MAEDAARRVRDWEAARGEEAVAFLQELIRLQPQGEAAVQRHIADALEGLGCDVQRLRYRPAEVPLVHEFAAGGAIAEEERESVVARLRGTGGGRSLIFFGHPDGEPVRDADSWHHDPFAGTIADGRLHGWGVADDLAGVAGFVQAVRAVVESGLRPAGDVILASTPSKRHARGVHAVLHDGRFLADAAVYMHPAESGVGMREIKALASGQLICRITIPGRPPATTEPGHTAFAHQAVNPIEKIPPVLAALRALDERRAARVHHPALQAAVGRSTNILVGSVQGGVDGKATVVGSACTLSAAISFPPGEPMEAVQAEVEAALQEASEADPWLRANPVQLAWLSGVTGAEVPVDHPLYRTVSAAIGAVTGQEPFVNAMHTSSDIRNPMVQKGIPTVGLGPLCGDLTQTGRHDEWVDVADYRRCVAVAAQLIAEWCGAT